MKIGRISQLIGQIPGFSLLDRYLSTELILPFIFGMGLFTSLGIAIGSLFDLVRRITESGLPISVAFQILLLKMPQFIVFAFPMSMLLASLMAYSRLSSDSELIALRSIGITPYRLILPMLLLSLVASGATFFMSDYLAPAGNRQAAIIMAKALKRERPSFIEDNIIYPEYNNITKPDGSRRRVMTRLFYAEKFNGQQMQQLTILDRSQPEVNQIVTAEAASWNIEQNIWDFYNGTIYLIDPDGSYRNIVRFEHQQLALPRTVLDVASRAKKAEELSLQEAQKELKLVKLGGDDKKVRKLLVRIQEKIAFPFICVIFGLIGAAVGIRPQNTNRATSFGVCIVLIFSYYLMSFISSSLGIWGIFSPFIAAWLPNFLWLAAGGFLFMQSAK
jgi:lipopolysaccharide export system permease protein